MTVADIAAMPVAEKLKLMEALWDSLSARPEGEIESPAWHEAALKQAEDEVAAGSARFIDLAEAKESLHGNSRA